MKQVKFGVSRHFGHALWSFLIMMTIWLKLVIFEISGHYLENVWELMSRGGRRHISDALRRVLPSSINHISKLHESCKQVYLDFRLFIFTLDQFWSSGIVATSVCLYVNTCVNLEHVRTIARHSFKSELSNIDQIYKTPRLRLLLFGEFIHFPVKS